MRWSKVYRVGSQKSVSTGFDQLVPITNLHATDCRRWKVVSTKLMARKSTTINLAVAVAPYALQGNSPGGSDYERETGSSSGGSNSSGTRQELANRRRARNSHHDHQRRTGGSRRSREHQGGSAPRARRTRRRRRD